MINVFFQRNVALRWAENADNQLTVPVLCFPRGEFALNRPTRSPSRYGSHCKNGLDIYDEMREYRQLSLPPMPPGTRSFEDGSRLRRSQT
jgi:hypothetical protein